MSEEKDMLRYMMASEKLVNLLFTIENTLSFMKEYAIRPDDEVKKSVIPLIKQLNAWIEK